MKKKTPTKKSKQNSEREEIQAFADYLQVKLGLNNLTINIDLCNTVDVADDAEMLGVNAKHIMGHNDSGRPGYTGMISGRVVSIRIVKENHKDLGQILHTLAHELLHSKLWWCAPEKRGDSPVVETLLEETINRLADALVDCWENRKKT